MKAVVLFLLVGACGSLSAHDVITTKITWSREISRLFYNRCAACHRESGSSFSLTKYEEARPWAKAIKEEALERRMPPWGAVKGFGNFRDDQGLTQEELHLISDWVEGGAPEGDPALLPKLPDFGQPAPVVSTGPELTVDGLLTLSHAVTVMGIRPSVLMDGSSIQVVARKPDGSFEPLLWLYQYKPQYTHTYFYRSALHFPVGTRIETTPAGAGTVSLILSP
ncbi:MAG: hypothetical protein M3O35_07560 [Acidobacteriota bacterium]|nr:hypothetical protein [Acidobacteriota bacterium]